MERKFKFAEGEYYHIYNRGNNKVNIFLDNKDKERFLKLLLVCNSRKPVVLKLLQGLTLEKFFVEFNTDKEDRIVDIGAYCLMDNHFHLLVKEKTNNGISLFMKKLLTAYSMYFNKKSERSGRLFERAFMARHADNDNYLKYLFSYIHLNPIKYIDPTWKENGIKDKTVAKEYLSNYRYSSYLDYSGNGRLETNILNKISFPRYFLDKAAFDDFIDDWITFQGLTLESYPHKLPTVVW